MNNNLDLIEKRKNNLTETNLFFVTNTVSSVTHATQKFRPESVLKAIFQSEKVGCSKFPRSHERSVTAAPRMPLSSSVWSSERKLQLPECTAQRTGLMVLFRFCRIIRKYDFSDGFLTRRAVPRLPRDQRQSSVCRTRLKTVSKMLFQEFSHRCRLLPLNSPGSRLFSTLSLLHCPLTTELPTDRHCVPETEI